MRLNLVAAAVALPLLGVTNAFVIPHNFDGLAPSLGNIFSPNIADQTKNLAELEAKNDAVAPLVSSEAAASKVIDDSYIIVFNDNINDVEMDKHLLWLQEFHAAQISSLSKRGVQHPLLGDVVNGLKHIYNIVGGIKGYSGRFHAETIDVIRRSPFVKFVEKDSMVHINEFETQIDAPWGLARISHRKPLSLGTFNKYLYDSEGGEGVTAYVIDTGTNIDHVDLEGRAKWGATIPEGDEDYDGNGHGSHCSGTIAGARYGVAKRANVVAVKVLRSDGSGSMSDVIKGVEFAAEAHLKDAKTKKHKGSTANMSLGGGKSPALDLAVNSAVRLGLHFAVAAGNDNSDACSYSPAAAEQAITVGASSLSDERAYFSNFGTCVDIFAPGVNIQSIYTGSKYALATLSGTSMASPHVCGLLTYFLSLQPSTDSEFASYGAITPKQLKKNIIAYGTENMLSDIDEDTPNILIFNGAGANLTRFWSVEESTPKSVEEPVSKPIEKSGDHSFLEDSLMKILPVEQRIENELEELVHDIKEAFHH